MPPPDGPRPAIPHRPDETDNPPTPATADDLNTPATTDDRTGPYLPHAAAPVESVPGYEILGELGRGGMGVVYRAREVKLNRTVALKLVLGAGRADRRDLIRFLAEAEAAAAIDHPNVVRVYGYGESDGRPYMALEYLPGGSLAGKLDQDGRLPVRQAVDLVRQIAAGVAAAHALGIVHRDLKPGNVLLDAAGVPKVADFGLAKRGTTDLTKTGTVMGTPAYMAPEQAKGESKFVGPQADVWALGVILYECLTGQRPFAGDNWAVLHQLMSENPPAPRSVDPRVPKDLDLVCLKCLAKEPHERYPTAAELAAELGRFAAGQPVEVRSAGPLERAYKWTRRKPVLAGLYAAGTAAVLLFAIGTVFALQYRAERAARAQAVINEGEADSAKAVAVQAKIEADLARDDAIVAKAALATGQAYQKLIEGNALRALHLLNEVPADQRNWEWRHIARACQPEAARFDAGAHVANMAVSTDPCRVLAPAGNRVKVWDPVAARELTEYSGHADRVQYVVLLPKGDRAASVSADGSIHIWSVTTGKRLADEIKAEPSQEISRLAVSLDGKRLAWAGGSGKILVFDLDTRQPIKTLNGHFGPVLGLAFLPDGRLVSGGHDKTLRGWHPATGNETFQMTHRGEVWAVTLGPDGKHVWTGDEAGRVYAWDLGRQPPVCSFEVEAHSRRVWAIRFNPAGDRMLTGSMDQTAKLWELRTPRPPKKAGPAAGDEPGTPVVDRPVRVLRGHLNDVQDVAFLGPDAHLLTCAERTLRVFDPAWNGASRVLAVPPAKANPFLPPVRDVVFAPDGRTVLAVVHHRLRQWEVETGQLLPARPGPPEVVHAIALSPDGRTVAEALDKGNLRVRPLAGGAGTAWPAKTTAYTTLAFDPTGKWLASTGAAGTLTVWDAASGAKVWSVQAAPGVVLHMTHGPDGRFLATAGGDKSVKLWDAATGKHYRTFDGHRGPVFRVAFDPAGTRLASASADNTTRVWEIRGGPNPPLLRSYMHYVYGAAFGPGGSRLAEASGAGLITFYDTRTWRETFSLQAHSDEVLGVAFSPAGDGLASWGRDGTVRLWDAPLGIGADIPAWTAEAFDLNERANQQK
jgi:eukaryotic-like serine/threonine-protein kinase